MNCRTVMKSMDIHVFHALFRYAERVEKHGEMKRENLEIEAEKDSSRHRRSHTVQ